MGRARSGRARRTGAEHGQQVIDRAHDGEAARVRAAATHHLVEGGRDAPANHEPRRREDRAAAVARKHQCVGLEPIAALLVLHDARTHAARNGGRDLLRCARRTDQRAAHAGLPVAQQDQVIARAHLLRVAEGHRRKRSRRPGLVDHEDTQIELRVVQRWLMRRSERVARRRREVLDAGSQPPGHGVAAADGDAVVHRIQHPRFLLRGGDHVQQDVRAAADDRPLVVAVHDKPAAGQHRLALGPARADGHHARRDCPGPATRRPFARVEG